jgi:two-component system chemotaxis response regulator CheY
MFARFSRILVVDENAESRTAASRSLRILGYQMVDYAPDGGSALRLIGQNSYRLVLADWDMPSLGGQELLRRARLDQRRRCLPFLMAIDRWQKKFIEIVRDDGATLYLSKPFTTEILGERMAQVYTDASRLEALRLRAAQVRTQPAGLVTTPGPVAAVSDLWRHLRCDP